LVQREIIQNEWFEAANRTISKAEEEGRNRDALIMKGKLKAAKTCWEDEDYTCAKRYLEQIIPIPETYTTLTLGLILLPTHLRRRLVRSAE
jgi:hypothetical protein